MRRKSRWRLNGRLEAVKCKKGLFGFLSFEGKEACKRTSRRVASLTPSAACLIKCDEIRFSPFF